MSSLLPFSICPFILRHRPSCRSDHTIYLSPTLRHRAPHLPSQHIPKRSECFHLPFQVLIAALYKLDELACVDVWIARGVDVVDDLGWELDGRNGRVGGVRGVGGGNGSGGIVASIVGEG